MKWTAYINDASGNPDNARIEKFELENTRPSDTAYATQHAAKTYNVSVELILCLPDRDKS